MRHDALLSTREFWKSDNLYALWRLASSPASTEHPRPWNHANYDAPVDWKSDRPAADSQVRIIAGNDRSATICAPDLTPLGTAQFTFNPHGAALDGSVTAAGGVRVSYFGRGWNGTPLLGGINLTAARSAARSGGIPSRCQAERLFDPSCRRPDPGAWHLRRSPYIRSSVLRGDGVPGSVHRLCVSNRNAHRNASQARVPAHAYPNEQLKTQVELGLTFAGLKSSS